MKIDIGHWSLGEFSHKAHEMMAMIFSLIGLKRYPGLNSTVRITLRIQICDNAQKQLHILETEILMRFCLQDFVGWLLQVGRERVDQRVKLVLLDQSNRWNNLIHGGYLVVTHWICCCRKQIVILCRKRNLLTEKSNINSRQVHFLSPEHSKQPPDTSKALCWTQKTQPQTPKATPNSTATTNHNHRHFYF